MAEERGGAMAMELGDIGQAATVLRRQGARRGGQPRAAAPGPAAPAGAAARRRSGSWLVIRLLNGEPDRARAARPARELRGVPARRSCSSACSASSCSCPLLGAGRSPHVLYRPSEIDVVARRREGRAGRRRRGRQDASTCSSPTRRSRSAWAARPAGPSCSRARPARARPTWPRPWPARPACPFLFVSSSAFQSMYYGQTNRKIRSYFKALRNAARQEGGAIGFIEEIDAIGAARSGMGSSAAREGISGVVNELLIQLQSLRPAAPRGSRVRGLVHRPGQPLPAAAPASSASRRPPPANVLVIGATNRAADLDPALLRPGRFDRSIYFDLPSRSRPPRDHRLLPRQEGPRARARRPGQARHAGRHDVRLLAGDDRAPLRRGPGLGAAPGRRAPRLGRHPAGQDDRGDRPRPSRSSTPRPSGARIATHEAGHATVAYLVGKSRKLEVLSIIKRKDALGLLAHSDREERFTKTQSEIEALIQIAFGGMVAEELFFGEAGTGPVRRPAGTPPTRRPRWSARSAWAARSSPTTPSATAGGANLVAKVLANDEGKDTVEGILVEAKTRRRRPCSRTTATSSRRCATPCSTATSSSATRSSTIDPPGRARRRVSDHRPRRDLRRLARQAVMPTASRTKASTKASSRQAS